MSPPRKKPLATGTVDLPSPLTDGTYLYRAYCRCGDLLYVGISYHLFSRLGQHAAMFSAWEPRMARLEWEYYRDRHTAQAAERHLIATLQPRFNQVYATGRRPIWRDLPAPRFLTEHELNWRAVCTHKGIPFLEWLADQWEAA